MVAKELEKRLEELEEMKGLKPSTLEFCWGRLEYSEESRRPEETCCHPVSSKGQPADASVKN